MFTRARFTLTAWYLLIIMFVSISFSIVIYTVLSHEVERFARSQKFRIERRLPDNQLLPAPSLLVDSDLVSETKHRLIYMLVVINSVIFIVSGGLGYILAGRTLQPIAEMLDEQHRFVSDSSHELRTPLTSLKSTMEVALRDKQLTLGTAKTVLRESVEDVNKLQSLSDELLQLAQYEKPNGQATMKLISLNTVITKAIQSVMPLAKQKEIQIKDMTKQIEIEGNKYGLNDLFVILLDNAIKYSPGKKSVAIRTRKTDGNVDISIEDEGIGIDEHDLLHIFDRFYRANTARSKTQASGYGLGLAIAKKIVDMHHGAISVKSKPHKGSIFTVTLPVKQFS